MKILTLNTHSLIEENYPQKLEHFVNALHTEQPEIIALQEVNQSCKANRAEKNSLDGYFPCKEGVIIRCDNHILNAVKKLGEKGISYYWSWIPIKLGYGRLEEGIGIMSKFPIVQTDCFLISGVDDFKNWKTRKALGVKTASREDWFYTIHTGWWGDSEEPFKAQWERLSEHLSSKKNSPLWLMGDFNCPAHRRGEGYDKIISDGWLDCYKLADFTEGEYTVPDKIDGWEKNQSMRIDYIFSNQKRNVKSCRVIFDGGNYPKVSDHFGVTAEISDREGNL